MLVYRRGVTRIDKKYLYIVWVSQDLLAQYSVVGSIYLVISNESSLV